MGLLLFFAGEDGSDLSAAGQMDTVLGVGDITHLHDAIRTCWASYFSRVAVSYRHSHGQPVWNFPSAHDPDDSGDVTCGMAVVVQRLVRADAAGVLFTRDPLTGHPARMVVNANFGLGESVVSGACDPDVIKIARTHNDDVTILEKEKGAKATRMDVTGITTELT